MTDIQAYTVVLEPDVDAGAVANALRAVSGVASIAPIRKLEVLTTIDDVLSALGGRIDVMRKFNVGNPAISNWRNRGFPPAHYEKICHGLEQVGKKPANELFPSTAY